MKFEFKRDNRAQLTVIGLLMIFLTILTASILMPTLLVSVGWISANLTAGGFVAEAIMSNLLPLFILVTLLATISMYGAPQR